MCVCVRVFRRVFVCVVRTLKYRMHTNIHSVLFHVVQRVLRLPVPLSARFLHGATVAAKGALCEMDYRPRRHTCAHVSHAKPTGCQAGRQADGLCRALFCGHARACTRATSTLLTNYVVLVWPVRRVACSRCCHAHTHIGFRASVCFVMVI